MVVRSYLFRGLVSSIAFVLIMSAVAAVGVNAQTGAWVELVLPDGLPSTSYNAAGDYCAISVAKTDSVVRAFDAHTGIWHAYQLPYTVTWKYNATAGENVALVYSGDSTAVGFSSINDQFDVLTYSGEVSSNDYACGYSLACLVTDEYVYVFDGVQAQWHAHDITGFGEVSYSYIYPERGYVLVSLRNSANEYAMIAYSSSTHDFFELYAGYAASWERLDSGFVAWNYSAAEGDRFFGGYSAVNGTWVSRANDDFTALETSNPAEDLHPRTSFMFSYREAHGSYFTHHLCGFDTRHTDFAEMTFDADGAVVYSYDRWNGAEFALQVVCDGTQGEMIKFYVYSGLTNSFQSYESALTDPSVAMSPRHHSCGGRVFVTFDEFQFMGYDIQDQHAAYAALPEWVPGVSPSMKYVASNTWGMMYIHMNNADSVCSYSYNRVGNSAQRLARSCESSASFSGTVRENVGLLTVNNDTGPDLMAVYTPGTDSWTEYDFSSGSLPIRRVERDYVLWNDEAAGELVLLDGITGQETRLDFASSPLDDYTFLSDNFAVAYSAGGIYTGYSTVTRDTARYVGDRLPSSWGDENLLVIGNTMSAWEMLAFNVLHGSFVPLSLSSEDQGYRRNIYVGGHTALVLTNNGYLIAFDPNGETGGCCTGASVGNLDCNGSEIPDMGDLTVMIDHLFIGLDPLCCVAEGDVDLSGQPDPENNPMCVDTGDLTVLIDHLFISLEPLPSCP